MTASLLQRGNWIRLLSYFLTRRTTHRQLRWLGLLKRYLVVRFLLQEASQRWKARMNQ